MHFPPTPSPPSPLEPGRTERQHQGESVTSLPTEATFATNRGTEQGDVLGTIQSALVLGQAREAHLGSSSSTSSRPRASATNGSSMTGKCSFVPFHFDPFLRALPLPPLVPHEGPHGNVKSSARLLCPFERQQEFQGWDTPYVHDTVDVLAPESGTTALGSTFRSREHINARAWGSVRACDEMLSAIGSVDHAPQRWSSPGSVPTCPSSCTTCASMETSCIRICWSPSMGSCGPPSAPRSTVICPITLGGKPPQVSPAAGWAFARRWGSRYPPSLPAAS